MVHKTKKLFNSHILTFLYTVDLSPDERHIATLLLSKRDEKSLKCEMKHSTMLRYEPQLTVAKLRRILKSLREKKILVGVNPPSRPDTHRPNRYFFYFDLSVAQEICDSWDDRSDYKVFTKGLLAYAKKMFAEPDFSLREKRKIQSQPIRFAAEKK